MTNEEKELLSKDLSARLPYGVKEEHIEEVTERKTLKDNLELYTNLSKSDMIKLLGSLIIGFLGYIVFYILLAATHVRASYIENCLLWYVIICGCFLAIEYIVPLMWNIYVLVKLKKILKKEYTEEIIIDGGLKL